MFVCCAPRVKDVKRPTVHLNQNGWPGTETKEITAQTRVSEREKEMDRENEKKTNEHTGKAERKEKKGRKRVIDSTSPFVFSSAPCMHNVGPLDSRPHDPTRFLPSSFERPMKRTRDHDACSCVFFCVHGRCPGILTAHCSLLKLIAQQRQRNTHR